jgi:hypothetical protein
MSCCGNKRAAISKTLSPQPSLAKTPVLKPVVWFQYTGVRVLTVIGKATNTRYRFFYSGARQAVDARDYATLAAVPSLRKTSAPQT